MAPGAIPKVPAGEECGVYRPAGFGDRQHGCVYQSGCVSLITNSPKYLPSPSRQLGQGPRAWLCVVTWKPQLLSFHAPPAFNTSLPRSPWPHPAGRGHRITQVWGQAWRTCPPLCPHSFGHNSAT